MSNIYLETQNLVDECCMLKCAKVPETESDCEAVNRYVECPRCQGERKVHHYSRRRGMLSETCRTCGGGGRIFRKHLCPIRRVNDNALYHNEMGWNTMLQDDLKQLDDISHRLMEERIEKGMRHLFVKERGGRSDKQCHYES